MTVSEDQIVKASAAPAKIQNVRIAAAVCDQTGLPFWAMLTILEKETSGINRFGHDVGGALTNYDGPVDASSFRIFQWLQTVAGGSKKSNGVGPMQLTWHGYFDDAAKRQMRPWDVRDNMVLGAETLIRTLKANIAKKQTVKTAWHNTAKAYSGKDPYALDADKKAAAWYKLIGSTDAPKYKLA